MRQSWVFLQLNRHLRSVALPIVLRSVFLGVFSLPKFSRLFAFPNSPAAHIRSFACLCPAARRNPELSDDLVHLLPHLGASTVNELHFSHMQFADIPRVVTAASHLVALSKLSSTLMVHEMEDSAKVAAAIAALVSRNCHLRSITLTIGLGHERLPPSILAKPILALPHLEELVLDTAFNFFSPYVTTAPSTLIKIDISFDSQRGMPAPEEHLAWTLRALGGCTLLESLRLSCTKSASLPPAADLAGVLERNRRLRTLLMENLEIKAASVSAVAAVLNNAPLLDLNTLSLEYCKLPDPEFARLVTALSWCTSLRELNLSDCKVLPLTLVALGTMVASAPSSLRNLTVSLDELNQERSGLYAFAESVANSRVLQQLALCGVHPQNARAVAQVVVGATCNATCGLTTFYFSLWTYLGFVNNNNPWDEIEVPMEETEMGVMDLVNELESGAESVRMLDAVVYVIDVGTINFDDLELALRVRALKAVSS
ncbi:hypothetical protein HK096_004542 [Nowakowskiella sp. JEL0078]|nr:hypothetical protein HK096_004542 [Nowakowskiella sp. JEL0078]